MDLRAPSGMTIAYDDDDVVVDKPVGVAAVADRLVRPDVVVALPVPATASTSGAPERQGVVHRLDVGTTGPRWSRRASARTPRQANQFKESGRSRSLRALAQGHWICCRPPSMHRPRLPPRMTAGPGGAPGQGSVTYDETSRRPARLAADSTGDGDHHCVHLFALRHPCVGDLTYGADPALAKRLGLTAAVAARPGTGLRAPGTGERVELTSPYPDDLQHALDLVSAAEAAPSAHVLLH